MQYKEEPRRGLSCISTYSERTMQALTPCAGGKRLVGAGSDVSDSRSINTGWHRSADVADVTNGAGFTANGRRGLSDNFRCAYTCCVEAELG
jgi:hypothetical protein